MKNRNSVHVNGNNPSSYNYHAPLIEINGNRRVLVECHRGVIAYNDNEVIVKTGIGEICVTGENLKLCRMCRDQLVIVGSIISVALQRGN